jgi:hypothetical protein
MPRVGLIRLKVRLCQGTDRPQHSDDEQNDAHDRLWLFQLLIRGLRCFDTNALCILSIINKAIRSLRSKEFTKPVSFQGDFSSKQRRLVTPPALRLLTHWQGERKPKNGYTEHCWFGLTQRQQKRAGRRNSATVKPLRVRP